MRKLTLSVTVLALMLFAVACGGGSKDTPNAAMEKMKDAFASLDAAKFEPLYTSEAWKSNGEKMKKELEGMKKDGVTVALSWTEADIKMDGEKASVKAKMRIKTKDGKEEDESETFELANTGGKWLFTK